jgi:hypothetical protein
MTTNELKVLDDQLNRLVLEGKVFEALERFYDVDCEMQENNDPACCGLAANIEREKQFFATVDKYHSGKLLAQGLGDGVTFGEWESDVEFKGGTRVLIRQSAVRRWKNGKVVNERFYHK